MSLRGLTTILPALGASICFCVCRCCSRGFVWFSYWFDKPWFSLREILISIVLHLLSSSRKIPTQLTSSRKNFWRRCRGDITKSYQVPSHKLSFTCSTFYLPSHDILIFDTHKTEIKSKNKDNYGSSSTC